MPDPVLVEHQSQIDEICSVARTEGAYAFDTEFVMEDRYQSEVCLVQLATREAVYLVDPLLDLDITPLWDLAGDPTVETVVHAGQEDLAICVQHTGTTPRHVFDVQIAAGFVGLDYPLSLQKLVQSMLHVRLHKARTLTDWRRRPLSVDQLRYGAEDVAHLLEIRRRLGEKLERQGRAGWATEEFKRFEEPTLYRLADKDRLFRIKGISSLSGQRLAAARDLLAWRESAARRLNRPARVVLKDHLLVEIARHGLVTTQDIRSLRGINLSKRDVAEAAKVVSDALALPDDRCPESTKPHRDTPRESAFIAIATAVLRAYCIENDLAYGLCASKDSLRELIRFRWTDSKTNDAHPALLCGWRGRSIGVVLDAVLRGEVTMRIEVSKDRPTIRFEPADP